MLFGTFWVVRDLVVGSPSDAKKILLFNVHSRVVTVVNHNEVNEDFMFATSCVVGDFVVGLLRDAKKILLLNM